MSMRRQKQADIGSGETKDFQDVCWLDNTYEDKRNWGESDVMAAAQYCYFEMENETWKHQELTTQKYNTLTGSSKKKSSLPSLTDNKQHLRSISH